MVADTLIKQLLEAGVHFGHQTKRWNPKMKKFIFGERSNIYIIDLQQTAERLRQACEFLKELVQQGKMILFVGTKKQAQEAIASCANRCSMFYVNARWLGGTLTNFATIRKSVERLKELQIMLAPESAVSLTKKEKATLEQNAARLKKKLSGIVEMKKLPSALVIVDPNKEVIAVSEAKRLNIPVVALLDTNCNPEDIDYPIPGNDDAIKSIAFIVSVMAESILTGRQKYLEIKKTEKEQELREEKESKEKIDKSHVVEVEENLIEDIEKKVQKPEEPKIIKREPKTEQRRK